MNDQQHSSADALTDRQRRIMDEAAKHLTAWLDTDSCDCDGYGHSCGRPNVVRTRDELLELLAAPPVEQRAAALTEAQRKALETAVNVLNINWEHETANELWEAFTAPVSQPAAAPIDTPTDREFALSAAICVHPKGVYGDEGGSMCCPITHTRDASFAPSPADERAAFEAWWVRDVPERYRADTLRLLRQSRELDGKYGIGNAEGAWEGWQARAASANETGAEVAQWQSRLKDRSSPVVDHWVNISPDGAKTLMEKYADVYEVRALYAAPQPAQADARVGLTDEQIETLAHRRAYRYRHGPDSIEFIFNRHCLLNFARALLQGANQ
ncbi:hypothetical protein [Burkholderia multivorans]|uniref:hypothetical protein n=1 Tax=Burkholderia multivorans TaxID=87883 RepID=UPI0020B1DCCC|nr:hypothetical protein [Burkholderia multivorans]